MSIKNTITLKRKINVYQLNVTNPLKIFIYKYIFVILFYKKEKENNYYNFRVREKKTSYVVKLCYHVTLERMLVHFQSISYGPNIGMILSIRKR